jgi:hypothetical protein
MNTFHPTHRTRFNTRFNTLKTTGSLLLLLASFCGAAGPVQAQAKLKTCVPCGMRGDTASWSAC